MKTFKADDIVTLKSGGPEMTVQGESPVLDFGVRCQWFGGKKLEHGDFSEESLVLVKHATKG